MHIRSSKTFFYFIFFFIFYFFFWYGSVIVQQCNNKITSFFRGLKFSHNLEKMLLLSDVFRGIPMLQESNWLR